jgi:hypothetical protein
MVAQHHALDAMVYRQSGIGGACNAYEGKWGESDIRRGVSIKG